MSEPEHHRTGGQVTDPGIGRPEDQNPRHRTKQSAYKRWFDLSVLISSHILLLPLWLVLWTVIPLLIWLGDRGPVFYKQQRMGLNGVSFRVIKFRTMIVDAENQGPAWTTDHDPRITRVGRILRRTALDELPEIISIWQGKMSFVGPRALGVDEQRSLEELIPGFEKRLQVRPGLTGLAQIYDKSDDPYTKFRYDMEYIQRRSPFLDAWLISLSVWNTVIARWDHRSGKTKLAGLYKSKSAAPEATGENSEPTPTDTENDDR
ncbi:MAG: sugar transferase [Chloroflexi bacterium]|nr:sugar transferase [Chloroflexota bacterium]MDA1271598.1 sugar transferase [Chloroflexota bacterium]